MKWVLYYSALTAQFRQFVPFNTELWDAFNELWKSIQHSNIITDKNIWGTVWLTQRMEKEIM